jgi:predicted RNA binding protein YcfA (HicA-like mRNA interferase family)
MKVPREVSGEDLARLLAQVGYHPTRQTGSHIRARKTGGPQEVSQARPNAYLPQAQKPKGR